MRPPQLGPPLSRTERLLLLLLALSQITLGILAPFLGGQARLLVALGFGSLPEALLLTQAAVLLGFAYLIYGKTRR